MWRYIALALLTLSLLGGGFGVSQHIELRREQSRRVAAEARLQLLRLQAAEQEAYGVALADRLNSATATLQSQLANAQKALTRPSASRRDRRDALVGLIHAAQEGSHVEGLE